jgi:hypothetical protein
MRKTKTKQTHVKIRNASLKFLLTEYMLWQKLRQERIHATIGNRADGGI